MVPPARKRWNPIQGTSPSNAKTEVSLQPECVLIKSRGKGEQTRSHPTLSALPRELSTTFRFFKRPSNQEDKKEEWREKNVRWTPMENVTWESTRVPSSHGLFLCRIERRGFRETLSRDAPLFPFHDVAGPIRGYEAVARECNETGYIELGINLSHFAWFFYWSY